MKSTLASLAEMWPLLCIGLVLALIAGFFVWILDTWHNQDEFPRPFLIGVFEGFWWSFISMTTVGEFSRVLNFRGGVFSENPIFLHQIPFIMTPSFYDTMTYHVRQFKLMAEKYGSIF